MVTALSSPCLALVLHSPGPRSRLSLTKRPPFFSVEWAHTQWCLYSWPSPMRQRVPECQPSKLRAVHSGRLCSLHKHKVLRSATTNSGTPRQRGWTNPERPRSRGRAACPLVPCRVVSVSVSVVKRVEGWMSLWNVVALESARPTRGLRRAACEDSASMCCLSEGVDTGVTLGRVREKARILSLIASGAACLQARGEGVWRCYVCESLLRQIQWTSILLFVIRVLYSADVCISSSGHVLSSTRRSGMQEQRAL